MPSFLKRLGEQGICCRLRGQHADAEARVRRRASNPGSTSAERAGAAPFEAIGDPFSQPRLSRIKRRSAGWMRTCRRRPRARGAAEPGDSLPAPGAQ